jgi:hypothetical protein
MAVKMTDCTCQAHYCREVGYDGWSRSVDHVVVQLPCLTGRVVKKRQGRVGRHPSLGSWAYLGRPGTSHCKPPLQR